MPNDRASRSHPPEGRSAEAHYQRLFRTVPVGIYALDPEGHFTELNPGAEQILGRSAEDLLGSHFATVAAPEELDAIRDLHNALVTGEVELLEVDLHVTRPDGERRLVHLRTSRIIEGGEFVGTHGIATDVTEERERERFAHRTERLATIGTLLSGVAHELNNPLNAIRNFAELLLFDPRPDEDREALEIIRNEADRAARLVAELRSVARPARDPGGREPIDVNELVLHVLQLRRYAFASAGITVEERLGEGLPPVMGDEAELREAVLKLVLNAEEALALAEGPRTLEVATRATRAGVQIRLADSGRGIDPDHIARVFDPFWTTKAPGEGAGLGLSLAHRVVTDHGGEVRVESTAGNGTVVTIELPATTAMQKAEQDLPLEPRRPLRVLVVDDEPALRKSVARFLTRRGHAVVEVPDGETALQTIARAADFDVILTDLRMPGLDGEALIGRLREESPGFEHRVVVITGDRAHADRSATIAELEIPVLVKPVALEEIAATLEQRAELPRNVHVEGR